MEDMSELIARSQSGDTASRDLLIEKNLGLVHHIVRRFVGRGCEAEDLFQIGTIGLMKAIDKFDLSLGLKFSTYAVPMIAGEMKRFLRDDGPVKVSRTIKENSFKINQARQRFTAEEGREPTLNDICVLTGLPSEDVVTALESCAEVESIYSSVSRDDGSEMYLIDKLAAGGNTASPAEDREKDKLLDRMLVGQLLSTLSEGEKELIRLRYFNDKTQTEIAGILGISQVQVSRLEKKILLRLREKLKG